MVNVQSWKGCNHWVPVREIVNTVFLCLGDVENLVLRHDRYVQAKYQLECASVALTNAHHVRVRLDVVHQVRSTRQANGQQAK